MVAPPFEFYEECTLWKEIMELIYRSGGEDDRLKFADFHLHICEKRELLGANNRLLYICRKKHS